MILCWSSKQGDVTGSVVMRTRSRPPQPSPSGDMISSFSPACGESHERLGDRQGRKVKEMARTINGNLTGQAAHGQDELGINPTQPNAQDKRIIQLKRRLRELMGDEWEEFYRDRPLNGDLQERYFQEKFEEILKLTDPESYYNCRICTLAPAMRHCKICRFECGLRLGDAVRVVYMETPTVYQDWPWTDDDLKSELMNHRPEVGF